MNEPKTYYRRHLPHYQPSEAMYHVVFRLAGSLPVAAIESLRLEREQAERAIEKAENDREKKRLLHEHHWSYFERFDEVLDGNSTGPLWLREPAVANIVKEALHHRDGTEYDLLAYCIMPNHVHVVFQLVAQPVGRLARADQRGLLENLDGTGVPSYRFTGTHINYYFVCKRKLWLFAHDISMEHTSDAVLVGKLVDESSYQREEKAIDIEDSIVIDWIDERSGILHEVKKSDKMEEAHV